MRRIVGLAVLLFSPAVLLAAPSGDAPSMTGLWKIAGDVTGRPVTMMCQLNETDRKLSGVCSGEEDGNAAHKITGTVKGQKVQFYFQASIGGGPLMMIVSGTLSEDRSTLDGSLDVEMGGNANVAPTGLGGLCHGVREAESGENAVAAEVPVPDKLAAPSPIAAPMDATGAWKIAGDVQGTQVQMICMLAETERKLTGTCTTGQDGTARSVTGGATESGVGWHFDSEYQGQPISVQMNATMAADGRMNGTMAVAPFGAEGTFVATKEPAAAN